MEVLFLSQRLRDDCSLIARARTRWGEQGAYALTLRLQQLSAAGSLEDMRRLPGRCRPCDGDRADRLLIDVEGSRALLVQLAADTPANPQALRWDDVTEIIIIDIIDVPV